MVVQGASTGIQRILPSSLGAVVADCRRKQLKPPAMVVVGQVVQHRTPERASPMPLAGKRILATCCAQETEMVCAALRRLGAEPLPYPTYLLEDCEDAEGWARFAAVASAGGWCLFTNELEVRSFIAAMLRNGLDLRSLGNLRIAALGCNVEEALFRRGIRADRASPSLQPKILRRDLNRGEDSNPANLVIVSRDVAIDPAEWATILQVNLFCTKAASWESHWVQEIRNNPPDFILFRNPAAVHGFIDVLGREAADALAGQSRVIATDDATASAAHRQNLECVQDVGFLQSLNGSLHCVE
jgi:uroporphyrinogen-III synthase